RAVLQAREPRELPRRRLVLPLRHVEAGGGFDVEADAQARRLRLLGQPARGLVVAPESEERFGDCGVVPPFVPQPRAARLLAQRWDGACEFLADETGLS